MRAICEHVRGQAVRPSLQAVAAWSQTAFKLPQPPSASTICRTLKKERELAGLSKESLDRTRTQPEHVTALDTMLLETIMFFETGNVALTGRLVIWLGKHCADELRIPQAKRPKFTRGGWLRHFQARHGIRCRRAHGEIGSVDMEAARAGVVVLRKVLAAYNPTDVYNMDEAAFFYRALAKRSLC
ncbi:hypothetical protein BBJ28_00025493, partial [Nothophytophthora sp. Chile5]